MKKTSLFMIALGALAVVAGAKPTLRKAEAYLREKRGETASGMPSHIDEEDMQRVELGRTSAAAIPTPP